MSPCRDKNLRNFFSLALGLQLMSTERSAWASLSAWTVCKGRLLLASGGKKKEKKKSKNTVTLNVDLLNLSIIFYAWYKILAHTAFKSFTTKTKRNLDKVFHDLGEDMTRETLTTVNGLST